MRQQLADAAAWLSVQSLKHIADVRVGIKPVEFDRVNQAHERCGSLASSQAAGKQPTPSTNGNQPMRFSNQRYASGSNLDHLSVRVTPGALQFPYRSSSIKAQRRSSKPQVEGSSPSWHATLFIHHYTKGARHAQEHQCSRPHTAQSRCAGFLASRTHGHGRVCEIKVGRTSISACVNAVSGRSSTSILDSVAGSAANC